jgi:hypothetical protein
MTYFFDTYALVEMIRGSKDYARFIDESVRTTLFNLGELHYRFLRDGIPNPGFCYLEFRNDCIPIESRNVEEAMEFKYMHRTKKFSFIDSLGYVIARENDLLFLTGDEGFRNIPGVEFVK